jgi:PBP1b-binding outer membrane lipoprotein LpoB
MRIIVSLLIGLLMLTGCSQSKEINSAQPNDTTHNPTAKEILLQNPNADIFQLNGIIYSNADKIEWVQQVDLTLEKTLATIKKQYEDGMNFEDQMATQLPVGAEIYEPVKKSGAILIVKIKDVEIRYLGLIEG